MSVNGTPLRDPSGAMTAVVLALEDVTERKRYQDRLVAINELSRDLTSAETERAVGDLVVEAARETLGLPAVALALYDEQRGRLRHAARTPAVTELGGGDPLFAPEQSLPWRVFSDQTKAAYADLQAETDLPESATPLESAMLFPLGEHGVLIAGATTTDAFSALDVSPAEMIAGTTRSALDRVDRERTAQEHRDTLAERTEALERVQRINSIIRGITTDLIRASTREEIVQGVCDRFAAADVCRFAWIGARDPVTDEVVPEAWAGVEDGYLETVTVTADERPTGQGPTGRGVRSRDPQVQNDLATDPPSNRGSRPRSTGGTGPASPSRSSTRTPCTASSTSMPTSRACSTGWRRRSSGNSERRSGTR